MPSQLCLLPDLPGAGPAHRLLGASLAAILGICATASAQHRFAPVTKNAVPYWDQLLSAPVFADFDGNGSIDCLSTTNLFTNQGGQLVQWPTSLAGLNRGLGAYDFDGDGRPDLLHGDDGAYPSSSSLRVSLNRLPTGFVTGGLSSPYFSSLQAHAVADFDGDGDLDLVLIPYSSFALSLQLANDGLGNFTNVSAARMPTAPVAAVAATPVDTDRDGDLDLVVSLASGQLQWLENDGTGVLAAPSITRFPAGYGVVLGQFDYDGDGHLDLCVENGAVLLNRPTGYIVQPQVFPVISGPSGYRFADFDGDGDLDTWVEAFYGGGCFENVGGGVFVDRRSPPIYRAVLRHAITDFDGDGRLDVVAASTRIEVLLGQPGCQFHDSTRWATLGECHADFDGDGLTDQLYYTSGSVYLRRSIGAGDYVETVAFTGWITRYHAVVDIDGDGDLDIVGSGQTNYRLGFYFNDGAGHFTASLPVYGAGFWYENPQFVGAGDLDGDGDQDVVTYLYPYNTTPQLVMFENQGNGALVAKPAWTIPGLQGLYNLRCALFDVDGDGDADLIAGGNDPQLYANDGTGAMAVVAGAIPALHATYGFAPTKLVKGDVDGDGDTDLVAGYFLSGGGSAADATVFLNSGNGSFVVGPTFLTTTSWRTLDLVDADADGDLDLVASVSAGAVRRIELRANDGAGNFALPQNAVAGVASLRTSSEPASGSQFADLDDDGDIDILGTPLQSVAMFNQTRHLRVVTDARLGQSLQLEFANPDSPATRAAAFLVSTRRLAVPLRFPGMGPIVVDPAVGTLLFGSGSGAIPLQVALPSDPGLLGTELFAQAALLSGSRVDVTNAVREPMIL